MTHAEPVPSRARVAENCSSCGHGEHKAGGFVRCKLGPVWRYNNPATLCLFERSHWVPPKAAE